MIYNCQFQFSHETEMAEAELRCNLQSCRKLLDENVLVTCCSHIFCSQHGQVSITNENCLACGTKFKNNTDFSITNLQPTDQNKSMMLSGLNPDQILEIANRSISFYTYQLFNENRLKDEMLKKSKEEFENLKCYCHSLKSKYKADMENLQRTTIGLKKELEEKIRDLEKQREQICQYSRLSKKLQLDLAASKRQIIAMKTINNQCNTGSKQNFTPKLHDFHFRPEGNINHEGRNGIPSSASSKLFLPSRWPHGRYSD